jgi:hypothetical protein
VNRNDETLLWDGVDLRGIPEMESAGRIKRSKLYGTEVGPPLHGEDHIVVYSEITRIFVYVNRTMRL